MELQPTARAKSAAWADLVAEGIVPIRQDEAQGVRVIASTDLMEPVRKMLEDRDVHSAAPILLAGFSLGAPSATDPGAPQAPADGRPGASK